MFVTVALLSPGQLLAEERWVVKETSMSTCLLEEKTWRPLAFWKGSNYHWSATWRLARLWVPRQLDHSWRRDIHVPLPFVPLSDLIHEPLKEPWGDWGKRLKDFHRTLILFLWLLRPLFTRTLLGEHSHPLWGHSNMHSYTHSPKLLVTNPSLLAFPNFSPYG